MKKTLLSLIGITCLMCVVGCHKTCTCINYSGEEVEYTADEVKARDVSCAGMVIQSNTRYYSYCEWD